MEIEKDFSLMKFAKSQGMSIFTQSTHLNVKSIDKFQLRYVTKEKA